MRKTPRNTYKLGNFRAAPWLTAAQAQRGPNEIQVQNHCAMSNYLAIARSLIIVRHRHSWEPYLVPFLDAFIKCSARELPRNLCSRSSGTAPFGGATSKGATIPCPTRQLAHHWHICRDYVTKAPNSIEFELHPGFPSPKSLLSL